MQHGERRALRATSRGEIDEDTSTQSLTHSERAGSQTKRDRGRERETHTYSGESRSRSPKETNSLQQATREENSFSDRVIRELTDQLEAVTRLHRDCEAALQVCVCVAAGCSGVECVAVCVLQCVSAPLRCGAAGGIGGCVRVAAGCSEVESVAVRVAVCVAAYLSLSLLSLLFSLSLSLSLSLSPPLSLSLQKATPEENSFSVQIVGELTDKLEAVTRRYHDSEAALQVRVCCTVLQRVAVCCSVLQCVLQCIMCIRSISRLQGGVAGVCVLQCIVCVLQCIVCVLQCIVCVLQCIVCTRAMA